MKQGQENVATILNDTSIPTLLAICEFVSERLGEAVSPLTMTYTIAMLKGMFYKGKGRKKKINSPNGRRGGQ